MERVSKEGRGLNFWTVVSGVSLYLLYGSAAWSMELFVGRFSTEGLSGWEPKIFKGTTEYRLVIDGNRQVVQADSRAAASGLFKKIDFDPKVMRYLHWSWKIDHSVVGGDERQKSGDDYAARIYVVFPGRFFWQTKAVNYIWANRLEVGEALPNAYTANAMMLAVESGANGTGQWRDETRDILADYRTLFGAEPIEASAIAIMTDTDDTGSTATARYGDISLSSER